MADDNLDTTQDMAQGDDNTDQNVDTQQADDTQSQQDQPARPFTPEQEQWMGSWMGRIIKKQIDENVLPQIQGALQNNQQHQFQQPSGGENPMDKFNEQLQEMIFSLFPIVDYPPE